MTAARAAFQGVNGFNSLPPKCWRKFAAGAQPWTPLGEPTALPQTLVWRGLAALSPLPLSKNPTPAVKLSAFQASPVPPPNF